MRQRSKTLSYACLRSSCICCCCMACAITIIMTTIISGLIVMLALLVATELFFFLPKAILGSIIIIAVLPLISFREPFRLWKISKVESILTVITFLLTTNYATEEEDERFKKYFAAQATGQVSRSNAIKTNKQISSILFLVNWRLQRVA